MAERDVGKPAGVAHGSVRRAPGPAARQPSIKDIARLAHVSHPTVSRALQNSSLVNAETAAKIRKIAEDQGYRASAVARGLVTRRTRTIGLVVTLLDDPFSSAVACGVEETAAEHGYAVFLANSHADPERERRVVEELAERRVDGIIVTSSRVGALYLRLLKELDVPIVLVNDQYPGEFVHTVTIANQEGMRAATEHLIGLGHRRIAYLGDRNGYQADAARRAGYKAALVRAGIGFAPELATVGDGGPEAAMEAVHELLRLNTPPTAVCCYNVTVEALIPLPMKDYWNRSRTGAGPAVRAVHRQPVLRHRRSQRRVRAEGSARSAQRSSRRLRARYHARGSDHSADAASQARIVWVRWPAITRGGLSADGVRSTMWSISDSARWRAFLSAATASRPITSWAMASIPTTSRCRMSSRSTRLRMPVTCTARKTAPTERELRPDSRLNRAGASASAPFELTL